MRRISVVGNSGSGKTTLAAALAGALGVPHLELDSVFHQPGWTPLPADEFRALVAEFVAADGWVIDGNYSAVRELVWARADTVIWLDPPRRAVMAQLAWRTLRRAISRAELWNGNREPVSNFFRADPEHSILAWAWTRHHAYRERYRAAAADPHWRHLTFVRIGSRRQAGALIRDQAARATGRPVVSVGVTTPQHRADLFLDPAADPREGGPRLGDERTTLTEFLRCQRLTLQLKCDGLDAGQLAHRAVEPSTMSLLGLVRHMAEVERTWFRRRFAGLEVPKRYQTGADPDADFNGAIADPGVVEEAWAAWREEIAFAEQFAADHDLGFAGVDSEGKPVSLRELLVHMIEEYARHNGHADLLRERIDGRVGQ